MASRVGNGGSESIGASHLANFGASRGLSPHEGNLPRKPAAGTTGMALTLNASVTSNAGSPTGTVTFKSGTAVLGTATLNATGLATFTSAPLAAGSYIFTATSNGDTNFEPLESKSTKVTVK